MNKKTCTCIIPSMHIYVSSSCHATRSLSTPRPPCLAKQPCTWSWRSKCSFDVLFSTTSWIICVKNQSTLSKVMFFKLRRSSCAESSHSPLQEILTKTLPACRLNNALQGNAKMKPDPQKIHRGIRCLMLRSAMAPMLLFDADTSVKSNPWPIVSGWSSNRKYSILSGYWPIKNRRNQLTVKRN